MLMPPVTPESCWFAADCAVSVFAGTGTNGLAAQKVSELADAGFPGASAANAEGL